MNRLEWLTRCGLAVLFFSFAGAATLFADAVTITAQPNPAATGDYVFFTFSPGVEGLASGSLGFGDDTPAIMSIAYSPQDGYWYPCDRPSSGPGRCLAFQHTYQAPGTYRVTFDAMANGTSVSATLQVTVVSAMELRGSFVPTAAHLTGHNNVDLRTDLEVQNPGTTSAAYSISLLARGRDNSTPVHADLTLDPGRSVRYGDVLQTLFGFSGAGALCIVPTEGSVVATSRTYAKTAFGTYGSFVPAVERDRAIALGEDGRLIGLSHNPSLAEGLRTNVGMVNANGYPVTVDADFYLADGTLLGTASYDLQPFEFRQIDRAFEQFTRDPVEDGYVVIRMASGTGDQVLDASARLLAYASVIDNITGDPTYVPAIPTAQPQGNVSGYWSGTATTNAPDDCSTPTTASAAFTQDGARVTGTVSYGSISDCGVNVYTFEGSLLGSALFGALTHGSSTGTLKGTLSGASLELGAGGPVTNPSGPWFRFVMHLHR